MHFIKASDVVVGELFHSWNSYCATLETLAMGKPLIHKRNDADLREYYSELYPMIQASSADTVSKALQQVASDPCAAKQMGEGGRQWFLKYAVERPMQYIKQIISEKQLKRNA